MGIFVLFSKLKRKVKAWNNARVLRRRAKREHFSGHDHKLGVLAIMKNEAMNIDEWVQHYISMGAGKIFLIDNGSTDNTVSKAEAWVAKGVVELVQYPKRHRQTQHYWSAFKELQIGKKCQWLLVADLDEFWFCPSGETIAEQLPDFHKWMSFTSIGGSSAAVGLLSIRPASDKRSLFASLGPLRKSASNISAAPLL
ncbi:MAG: glycosyl transferase family 2 [Cypionkella sp.]|uniref:glycosyltransferase family 2 protein n=1 Tax=Cypionkella sp. TaxID=2811411 RepID=UPI002621C567|nr:glycosyltransferase family 2 protein [Cypionkella sp.]MDB5658743.1 glycosyl transferase family 2 [Cypionkella sp.]